MRKIKQILFEVCGACQKNCAFCSHSEMIVAYSDYQLSIEELNNFISCTKESGYFIEVLNMHGIGEPLLWEHFDEGIKLLKNSGIIGKISVITNGLLLDKIKEETMDCIDILGVSVYPSDPKSSQLKILKHKYMNKIEIMPRTRFRIKPKKRYDQAIPGDCSCSGPMFVKDKVFLYCGPPVFGAGKLKNADIFKYKDLAVNLQINYLKNFDGKNIGNLDFCSYCWANNKIKLQFYPLWFRPSKLTLILFNVLIKTKVKVKEFLINNLPVVYKKLKSLKDSRRTDLT